MQTYNGATWGTSKQCFQSVLVVHSEPAGSDMHLDLLNELIDDGETREGVPSFTLHDLRNGTSLAMQKLRGTRTTQTTSASCRRNCSSAAAA